MPVVLKLCDFLVNLALSLVGVENLCSFSIISLTENIDKLSCFAVLENEVRLECTASVGVVVKHVVALTAFNCDWV